jgi:hypothetical protein
VLTQVASSQMCLWKTWNVANETEKLNFKYYLINLNTANVLSRYHIRLFDYSNSDVLTLWGKLAAHKIQTHSSPSFFETGSCYAAHTCLEFVPSRLRLLNAWITGMYHHGWLKNSILSKKFPSTLYTVNFMYTDRTFLVHKLSQLDMQHFTM